MGELGLMLQVWYKMRKYFIINSHLKLVSALIFWFKWTIRRISSIRVIFSITMPKLVCVPILRRNGELNQVELNFKPSLSVLYVIYQSCQPFVSASLTSLLSASLVCNHISDCLEIWIQNGQKMFVVLICPYVLSFTYIIH